ncbi:MAG: hypothetical protein AAGG02_20030, partial [Cyanobacteria bacterium P01_H01_bin.15]
MALWCSRKQTFFYGGGALLVVFLILALGYLTPRKFSRYSQEICTHTIYLSGNWFHSSLILPAETDQFDWRTDLNFQDLG